MSSTESTPPARNRAGQPRKPNRRQLLTLRVDPELRGRLVAMAQEKGRTLTEQTETLLRQAINGSPPASPPEAARGTGWQRSSDVDQFSHQRLLAMLEAGFGRQVAGLVYAQAHAMLLAELDSIAWSRDVAERAGQLPSVSGRTGSARRERQLLTLWHFLHRSSPAQKGEQSWLSDDPYVFGQVANAARQVLETLAPEGNPSPSRSPRGISRAAAVDIMKRLGEEAAYWTLDHLTAKNPEGLRSLDEPAARRGLDQPGKADLARLKQCLGEAVVARLRQRLPDDGWEWFSSLAVASDAPTEGQNG